MDAPQDVGTSCRNIQAGYKKGIYVLVPERLAKDSVRDYAYRTLKQNIIATTLAPGSMVSENALAAELGISRTPVREALIELSKAELVEILPQKGCRITKIDGSLVEEAHFMRLVLERAIVEMICDTAQERDLEPLEDNLRLQEFYLARPSPEKLLELDNEFHRQMFVICRMNRVHYLMSSIMMHFDRVRSLSLQSIKDLKIVDDHRALLDAIRAKDKQRASRITTEHLERYRVDENIIRGEHPEYFEE